MLALFKGRILPVETAAVLCFAKWDVADKKPMIDGLIAATAFVHGLTVVTGNTDDFAAMDIPLIDPWQNRIQTKI